MRWRSASFFPVCFTRIVLERGRSPRIEREGGGIRTSHRTAPPTPKRCGSGRGSETSSPSLRLLTLPNVRQILLIPNAVPETLRAQSLGRALPVLGPVNVEPHSAPASRSGPPTGPWSRRRRRPLYAPSSRLRRAVRLTVEHPSSCCSTSSERARCAVEAVSLTVAASQGRRVRDRADPAHRSPDDAFAALVPGDR